MDHCPKCQSKDIHRSRAKTRMERWRQQITQKRPFRCRACNVRVWGPETGPVFGEWEAETAKDAMAPPRLDLHELDQFDPAARKEQK